MGTTRLSTTCDIGSVTLWAGDDPALHVRNGVGDLRTTVLVTDDAVDGRGFTLLDLVLETGPEGLSISGHDCERTRAGYLPAGRYAVEQVRGSALVRFVRTGDPIEPSAAARIECDAWRLSLSPEDPRGLALVSGAAGEPEHLAGAWPATGFDATAFTAGSHACPWPSGQLRLTADHERWRTVLAPETIARIVPTMAPDPEVPIFEVRANGRRAFLRARSEGEAVRAFRTAWPDTGPRAGIEATPVARNDGERLQ